MKIAGDRKVPDFIIIGAMKSGTTSIHSILAHNPQVFIPDGELNFFDVDNFSQHPDFFVRTSAGWTFHDFDEQFDMYFDWYTHFFSQALDNQIIGEDTTTYLASEFTAQRIQKHLPKVKLIAMLRDPVSRAYSHYWHNVSAGRVSHSFEHTLMFNVGNLIERGNYFDQLKRYKYFFDKGAMKVILFEEFINDQQGTIDKLCQFIGLPEKIDVASIDTHKNATRGPLWLGGRYAINSLYSKLLRVRQSYKNIPNMPGFHLQPNHGSSDKKSSKSFYNSIASKIPRRKYPPMKPETRQFLQKLFRKSNSGLSELVGIDVPKYWKYMA